MGWVFDVEGEEGFRLREEKIINELTEKQGIVRLPAGFRQVTGDPQPPVCAGCGCVP